LLSAQSAQSLPAYSSPDKGSQVVRIVWAQSVPHSCHTPIFTGIRAVFKRPKRYSRQRLIFSALERSSPNHRTCAHWLSAPGSSCWNFETRTTRRCLREASSNSRKNDGGNSELSEQRLEAAWSRRGGRGWARTHDDKKRAQAGRHYGHKLLIGSIQDTTGNSPGVSFCHQFEGWVMIPSSQGAPPPDRRSSALVRDPLNQGGVVPNEHVSLRNQATIEPES
jgi:hypothetical protein